MDIQKHIPRNFVARLPDLLTWIAGLTYSFLLFSAAHSQFSVLDEGLYLYKGFLFTSGRYIPFQNYGPLSNQMPFAFLIPGVIQVVFGPGLRVGRYFAVLLALLMFLAFWLVCRRLGNRWLTAGLVWAITLNLATTRIYSLAISEGMIAFLLMLIMALCLGENRPLWQLILAGLLSGLVVMIRINMLPVPFLVVCYIFWQHGMRKGVWAAAAGILLVVVGHALYWPNILRLWAYWLPEPLAPFLAAWRSPADAAPFWNPPFSYMQRLQSIVNTLRFHFIACFGVVMTWICWPKRTAWKNEAYFKIAVFLSFLFSSVMVMHIWATMWKNYCVDCLPLYTSFFSGVGLLLVAVSLPFWNMRLSPSRHFIAFFFILAIFSGFVFTVYAPRHEFIFLDTAITLIKIQVPRIRQLHILPGTVELWQLVVNLTGLSQYKQLRIADFLPFFVICAAVESVLVLMIWAMRKLLRRYLSGVSLLAGLSAILYMIGFLFQPSRILSNGWRVYECRNDEIASYEKVGKLLAQNIPGRAQIFWRGYSPTLLLYLPDVKIYPSQLNGDYSYHLTGESDALLRYGWWNESLGRKWVVEADYVLVEQKYYKGWLQEMLESGAFEELMQLPSHAPCRSDAYLRIFRPKPD